MYKVLEDQNKAGSFVNVATIQETYDETVYVKENVNDILVRKENQYQGWLCWSGQESIAIMANGDVYNAACRVKKLGNIYDGFEIPDEPVVCQKMFCVCASDLNTTKAKDQESAKYLRINNES